MDAALVQLVRERAGNLCEYCQLPQALSCVPFEIDHIIARKHGGQTVAENLANSCFYCNSFKSSNIAGLDSLDGALTRLFHPRADRWPDHFEWDGPSLRGRTAIGRTTIQVLNINAADCVLLRAALIREGVFPPPVDG